MEDSISKTAGEIPKGSRCTLPTKSFASSQKSATLSAPIVSVKSALKAFLSAPFCVIPLGISQAIFSALVAFRISKISVVFAFSSPLNPAPKIPSTIISAFMGGVRLSKNSMAWKLCALATRLRQSSCH